MDRRSFDLPVARCCGHGPGDRLHLARGGSRRVIQRRYAYAAAARTAGCASTESAIRKCTNKESRAWDKSREKLAPLCTSMRHSTVPPSPAKRVQKAPARFIFSSAKKMVVCGC